MPTGNDIIKSYKKRIKAISTGLAVGIPLSVIIPIIVAIMIQSTYLLSMLMVLFTLLLALGSVALLIFIKYWIKCPYCQNPIGGMIFSLSPTALQTCPHCHTKMSQNIEQKKK